MQEKRQRQLTEREADEEFHKQAIHRLKQDEEIEFAKVNHRKMKHLEFKNNLLLQMGQLNNSVDSGVLSQMSPSSVGGANVVTNRRRIPMEAMTQEEVRIHKQILQEISARKKERLERASL